MNSNEPSRGGVRPGAGRKVVRCRATSPKERKVLRPLSPFQVWRGNPQQALSELCEEIVMGSSLNQFIIARGFAYSTVSDWLRADAARWDIYWGACEDRSDVFADEIISIADGIEVEIRTGVDGSVVLDVSVSTSAVERDRVRIDARKWVSARMKPRVYGSRTDDHRKREPSFEDRIEALTRASSDQHPPAKNVKPAQAAQSEVNPCRTSMARPTATPGQQGSSNQ